MAPATAAAPRSQRVGDVDEAGKIPIFTGKVEVGQNIRTSLAQLVAEELRVPFNAITMVMGDTDLTPWDMGTFGSRSTPTMGPQLPPWPLRRGRCWWKLRHSDGRPIHQH